MARHMAKSSLKMSCERHLSTASTNAVGDGKTAASIEPAPVQGRMDRDISAGCVLLKIDIASVIYQLLDGTASELRPLSRDMHL